jgi:hypothetical protein
MSWTGPIAMSVPSVRFEVPLDGRLGMIAAHHPMKMNFSCVDGP